MRIFGYEPATILYAINAGVALLVAYGLPLSHDMVAAVTVIATAVLSIATAVMTRPFVVSSVTGAFGSLLAAVAAFGLHLSADQIGTAVTALSVVLMLLLRQNVTPAKVIPGRAAPEPEGEHWPKPGTM